MKFFSASFLALLSVLCNVASATETVTLPDTGVDLVGYCGALLTALGLILAAAVGAAFGIWAIIIGVRYIKRLLGGR
jgi:hypothetical protein